MSDVQIPFFVYGTLRSGERGYFQFLWGKTIAEVPAFIEGFSMYLYKDIPYVTPSSNRGKVYGELMYISPTNYSEILKAIDEYEEFSPLDKEHSQYIRSLNKVFFEGNDDWIQQTDAWVYHAGNEAISHFTERDIVISGDWLLK
jgi:gamma-glutamylcyclotransferase (GGCT)/AIG2-like uncharacterized protein YtfP